MHPRAPLEMAYLVSEYPAYSHTFILREIAALRQLGAVIHPISINSSTIPPHKLGAEEKHEQQNTYYIKKQGFFKALWTYFKTMATHPICLLKGMGYASKLAGWNLKLQVYHQFYLIEALLVAEWMRLQNLRHVHVHFANPASTVALFLNKIYSIPFSITVHGPDEFYDVSLNLLNEKAAKAKLICCISDYAKSQLMRCSSYENWEKFETVPLGVNPKLFTPVHHKLVSGYRPFQLICVGRLTSSKGQHLLISAMRHLILQGRDVHLKLIGEGSDRPALEAHIRQCQLEPHVQLLGALSQRDVLHEYEQADLFILASLAEGVPVALMEAMSLEIPCIAPRLHGIPELIRDGIDGILFSPANVEELTQVIASLIDQPEKRGHLGRTGRKRVQEKYDLERNVQSLYKVFLERIGNDGEI